MEDVNIEEAFGELGEEFEGMDLTSTEKTILTILRWVAIKLFGFLLTALDIVAFPLALLIGLTGCILIIIGIRKKGFACVGLSFLVYLGIQVLIMALSLT